ncbi:MAG: AAA family ATPase, partial [Pseudomonadota bacterium]|nr:AAA family ATPase [Pseudomonadota bacterium]
MLQSLHIKNFAIVTQLELQIPQGLTIISGETGAGKSILIDALGLVLGERADSQAVRQGCSYAQVSASFSISSVVLEWLQQHHLAQEEECLVRRIIYANGRSR